MIAPPCGENLDPLFASATSVVDPTSGFPDLLAALLANRPAWHADALCQEHPEVNFFPGQGDDVRPAKRCCAECLVKIECREWALDQSAELDGIWAGLSNKQRRELRAALPSDQRPVRERRPRVPSRAQEERKARPTAIMARISRFLAGCDEAEHRIVFDAVTGDDRAISRALLALADEGYITATVGGIDSRGRHSPRKLTYRYVRPFSEADDPPEAGAPTAA